MTVSLSNVKAKTELVKASEATCLIPKLTPAARKALLYLDGDYWQCFNAWVGANVPPEAENRTALLAEIERSFTPRPLIQEVEERQINGIIGQEPSFEFVTGRASQNDEKILAAFEKIKGLIKKQILAETQAQLPPAPMAAPTAGSTAPAKDGNLAPVFPVTSSSPVAPEPLDIGDAMAEMLDGLGLPDENDDFEVPAGVPDPWKAAIAKARVVKAEVNAERALLDEVNSEFGEWWDRRKGHEIMQEFLRQLCGTGRAAMRFYIPWGVLQDGKIQAQTWAEALDLIYLEVPKSEMAATEIDPATMGTVSIYSYQAQNDSNVNEQRAEVTFLADDGKTSVRILNDTGVIDEVDHDCAGQLFVDVATAPQLITEAVQRNQNALNVVNTMLLHNSNLAGHRERNYVNLQRPQKTIDDPTTASGKRLVDDAMRVGPRAANFLTGITYKDKDGASHIAPGSIVITDPVDPQPLIEAMDAFEDNILGAVSQKHTKISGDATASAVSRVQARSEHIKKLQGMSVKLEGVMRSRMMGIVALAMTLSDEPKDAVKLEAFKKLRASVRCNLDAGPLTPDERRVILEEYDAGVRSLEDTQILLGIEDVEKALQKLREEREGSLVQLKERALVMQALNAGGAAVGAAATVAGFDPEDVKILSRTDLEVG